MDLLKFVAVLGTFLSLALANLGCQLSYYAHSAYHQAQLIKKRVPVSQALESSRLTDEQKRKLRLIGDVKSFGEQELGLKKSSNYTSYIQLDEPYVTYIVQAAHAFELKPYLWSFPFVGQVPYKGYFKKALAQAEAAEFDRTKFDTYVRGVSAYSTLGWFEDSVLSSMLRYDDHDLAELILHESLHTTLFIKGASDFNERLATFMGHEGMKLYYLKKEGANSITLQKALDDSYDQKLFSEFLTRETEALKKWYEEQKGQLSQTQKEVRLKEIKDRFQRELSPKLKTKNYSEFAERELNNAVLLAYQTYEYSLEDFQKAYELHGRDFKKTLDYFKSLESSKAPAQTLKDFVSGSTVR